MQNDWFFWGELEISIANTLYNIKIATYREIYDNNNIIGFTPINYYIPDNSESRYLIILTNRDNIHFGLGYYYNGVGLDKDNEIPEIDFPIKNKTTDEIYITKNYILRKNVRLLKIMIILYIIIMKYIIILYLNSFFKK